MNLDGCTPGQRTIITTLDLPLMVSAGAGSGKTFTLTQRIAYALEEPLPSTGGVPFASGIDEVMAITFTRKAAAELKSRVKHRLLSSGLAEEALKVDDAWITTIHGACARILREHALELGLDPAFSVLAETDAATLRAQAFDQVIEDIRTSGPAGVADFIHTVGVTATAPGAMSIEGLVSAVADRACALPDGFDALAPQLPLGDPASLLRGMVERGEAFCACLEALPKHTQADKRHLEAMQHALEAAARYLDTATPAGFADEGFDAVRFANVFFSFPKTSQKYRSKESDPSLFLAYREEYSAAAAEVEAGLAVRELSYVIRIARAVDAAYAQAKGPARLDQTDLLRRAYQALAEHPAIAAAYRDQFKMIMIDEFQDTDELQVALISALAQPHRANVCTVGDAQQSIYRFRGADVNVFFGYRDVLAQDEVDACFVSLPDNFRSHADVLSFVDCVFSQPTVFGDRFLQLAPKGKVNEKADPLFAERPRIQAALFDCRRGGPGIREGQRQAATRIAAHFAELRDAGASPSDMVVLLGKMSQAGLYAEALRSAGFECLIAGGSTFSEADEVALVAAALRWLSSRLDDAALYHLLASPLFCVSDDALLHLATRIDVEGRPHRRALSEGLLAWQRERESAALTEEESGGLDFAAVCLATARRALAAQGATEAVRTLVRASGWFGRLEACGAAGQAQVGNVCKALRMCADIEAEGWGIARMADRFAADCEAAALSPGVLATTSSGFVRIMTVHASKGLEFPYVALADLRLTSRSSSLVAENIGGRTYLALKPTATANVRAVTRELRSYDEETEGTAAAVVDAASAGARSRALERYAADQELAEARRLLYVAATRASKSLFCSLAFAGKKDPDYTALGILGDLYDALSWDPSADAPVQMIDYGGSAPLRLEYTVLDDAADEEEAPASGASAFLIPGAPHPAPVYSVPAAARRADVFSYSSISAQADEDAPAADEPAFVASASAPDEDATALGTAFHRLAQRVICAWEGGPLACPPAEAIAAQERGQKLTPDQAARLTAALERWFDSDEAAALCRCAQTGSLAAEVPFMIALGPAPAYLEGEIDALALGADGTAHLVDYKTGGSPLESPAMIEQKHRLQAQCYALALLRQGCARVEASFVRVEVPDEKDPTQPQVQRYSFTTADAARLEEEILQKIAAS